ncbi:uncharacterized protein LAESUDRAFT_414751 [Laetiporus sulphureus 93-53]|uniref:DUF7598 domain-containing protein n=1 Tax=Laetiporus sulphureus 93-53 TaxID=1314785 RepID=A0A165C864_9APHY|nr:uncharacterized protein LAESUDRAFT_414751 [Laetiporus sulphureus 93-53]KZT02369.1 hypothetical protein LAESUDRAFT_414751 [Laetiporus sulphureus 93-53]
MLLNPRAYVFIGLNVLRITSILAMLLVFASSIFVMVKDVEAYNDFQSGNSTSATDCDYIPDSDVPNQTFGIFFAVINRILIIFEVNMLILSEVGWPAVFFDRFFPVLGCDFGVGPLGLFQCLIGAMILSHHVDDFTLVAAFFMFAVGCVNMLAGLIFREKVRIRRSILAWRERAKDILPTHKLPPQLARPVEGFVENVFSSKGEGEKTHEINLQGLKAGFGFGRQGEKKAQLKGFLISRPLETLPRYAPAPAPQTQRPASSRSSSHGSSRAGSPEPQFKSSKYAI